MARKDSRKQTHSRGFSDIIGIGMIALGLLLLVAQVTFDKNDVLSNRVPANETVHNWIGSVGAYAANGLFFLLGGGAFLIPILLLVYGLSCIFESWTILRRRWPWTVVLFLASLGLFDLYSDHLTTLNENLNAPSTGGLLGQILNDNIFGHFGVPGATILFATFYLISLLFLTNFRLSEWIRDFRARMGVRAQERMAASERALEQKAAALEREARRLQEEVDRSGLAADLEPLPEPTVRDLSVSGSAPKGTGKGRNNTPAEEEAEVAEAGPQEEDAFVEVAAGPEGSRPAGGGPLPEPVVRIADQSTSQPPKGKKKKPITVAATPHIGDYRLPSYDFLTYAEEGSRPTDSKERLMGNARLMQNTLAQFGIEVALGDITKGPTITRYELHPAPGVKMERFTGLTNNLAAALKAERINILAPVPGKSSVGIEVPNQIKTKVIMRDLFESEEWRKTKARLPIALGKDVYGKPIIADLADMPHLLIAGSTGSGKSVCINSIIASLLFRFGPDELRFVMIDPKVVELQAYNSLPHLVVPVVNDPKKVILALRWVVNEMEKRYQIFAKVGVRNIKSFNDRPKDKPVPEEEPELPLTVDKENVAPGADGFAVELDEEIVVPREDDIVIPDRLSYIVVIIDELADLMLMAPAEVEMAIARITQMARAAGIHCIVATQRPSVDVITGVIKANIPARIAFQVAAKVDSRTILDSMGADKLLGKGDMLYLPPGSAKLIRAQGALITDEETQTIVDFIAGQGKPSYETEIHRQLSRPASSHDPGGNDEDEELIEKCVEIIRTEQKASVSLLQRRLRLGYTRAARIMDELEDRGVVGPNRGAEPREILIDLDVAAQ